MGQNKPTIKSTFVDSVADRNIIIEFSFWKGYSTEYNTPDEPDTIEIDRILLENPDTGKEVDVTEFLYEVAEDYVMGMEEDILIHCQEL